MHLAGPLAFRLCGQLPQVSVAEAPPPTTGTFRAAGCVSFRAGAFDAVGDSNPVPERVTCPRPHRNVPARAGCPQPRRLSVGRPWHPEPLVRRLRRRRRPTTTSGPHTGARSGQVEEGATSSRRGGSQPWGESARPRRPNPGGVDPAGRPVSTALTSMSPPSKTSPRIVGILRCLLSVRRRCRVDVRTMEHR